VRLDLVFHFLILYYISQIHLTIFDSIYIYMVQGLSILKASLASTSALTNGLGHSIIHQFLRENFT
jgi:hypothetical protein